MNFKELKEWLRSIGGQISEKLPRVEKKYHVPLGVAIAILLIALSFYLDGYTLGLATKMAVFGVVGIGLLAYADSRRHH